MNKLLKAVAVVVAILGLIGSIMLANVPKLDSYSSILSGSIETEFSFPLFLGYFISTLLVALVFWALGEIIEYLDYIKDLCYKNGTSQKIEEKQVSFMDKAPTENVSKVSTWICKNCKTINSTTSKFCKSCDKSRY